MKSGERDGQEISPPPPDKSIEGGADNLEIIFDFVFFFSICEATVYL
jgi:hypothetical protein